jgi:heme o synthase
LRELTIKTNTIGSYFNLVKPRETLLLAFIGVCSGIIASNAALPDYKFILLLAALALGSAGCNGITNYLDRKVDAKMNRTMNRAIPRGRIYPAENALMLVIPLIVISLVMAWFVNPACFVTGVIGVLASTLWRKTVTCTIFGIIAGICPVLIGWFAYSSYIGPTIVLICLLVAFWIPIHVWSVMIARKDEYARAGLNYFPLSLKTGHTITTIFILAVILFSLTISLYLFGGFGRIMLVAAVVLSAIMVVAVANLLRNSSSATAWKVYRLSSFPFLGIIFLAMVVDIIFSRP